MHKLFNFLVIVCSISILQSQERKLLKTYVGEILNLEYESAYVFASNFDNPELTSELQIFANLLYNAGQEENFEKYTLKIVDEPDEESVIYCLMLLNKGYDETFHNPNEVDSFQYFYKAYAISKKINSVPLQKLCLVGILEFYHFQYSLTHEKFSSYLEEFRKLTTSAIETCWYYQYRIYFKLEDVSPEERTLHLLMKDFAESVQKLKKGHKFLPIYYSLQAVYYETEKLYQKATTYHSKVLSETTATPFNTYLFFRTYIRLAHISYLEKRFSQGFDYIKQAKEHIDLSDTLKSYVQIKHYSANLYAGLNDFENAYKNLRESMNAVGKAKSYQNNFINSVVEIQLQTREKEEQILVEQEQKEENFKINIVLGVLLFLGSVIVFLYYRNTKRKQHIVAQQLEIEKQRTETVLKDQELAAINAMILGQEKERENTANNLHDNVCAFLSAAKMQFEHVKERRTISTEEELAKLFGKTEELLNNAYDEVHAMAYRKNSGVMAKNGLLPAVENITRINNGINGLRFELQHHGLEQRLENSKEIFIFRIIQELIANIIKHAHAKEANISLTLREEIMSIIVEDDGVGIPEESLSNQKGLGLRSIEKRIFAVNGSIKIDTKINRGTIILIEIPI